MHIPSVLKPYINSDKEDLLWYSQPLKPDSSSTFKPVLYMLATLAGLFFIYAGYIIMVDLPAGAPNGLRNLLISFTMGSFFLIAWLMLPAMMKFQQNNSYYVVTDQRVMIIEHDPTDPNKSKIQEWGAGDIGEPSVKGGGVTFVVSALDLGKTEKGEKRAPLGWTGFLRLPEEEAVKAQKAIKELITPKDMEKIATVDNRAYKFSFKRPAGWTIRTYIIPESHRDDLLFTTLAGDAIEQYSILKGTRIDAEWNTAVLAKQSSTTFAPETGALHYLIIIIEAAAGDEEPPPGDPEKVDIVSTVNYNAAVKVKDFFIQNLRKSMMICELRKGIKITDETIKTLEGKVPKYLPKQLERLKDREFSLEEKDTFLKLLEKVIDRKEDFAAYKNQILKLSEMHHPLRREGDTKNFKLRVNKSYKEVELNAFRSFEMESSITFMETPYKIKQIYSYKYIKSSRKCLHLRYTFFCAHKEITKKVDGKEEKTTVFDQNKGALSDIARSTVLLTPKLSDILSSSP